MDSVQPCPEMHAPLLDFWHAMLSGSQSTVAESQLQVVRSTGCLRLVHSFSVTGTCFHYPCHIPKIFTVAGVQFETFECRRVEVGPLFLQCTDNTRQNLQRPDANLRGSAFLGKQRFSLNPLCNTLPAPQSPLTTVVAAASLQTMVGGAG